MRILIVGASRGLGLATLDVALSRGHEVVGLARSRSPRIDPRLRWFRGSVLSHGVIDHLLPGADAVVTTVRFDGRSPVTAYSEAAGLVTAAMARARVARLVAVTGFGSRAGRPVLERFALGAVARLWLHGHADDKLREEALIRDSLLNWMIVRPGILTNGGPARELHWTDKQRDVPVGSVPRIDVARFIVDAVSSDTWVRRTVSIVARLG